MDNELIENDDSISIAFYKEHLKKVGETITGKLNKAEVSPPLILEKEVDEV